MTLRFDADVLAALLIMSGQTPEEALRDLGQQHYQIITPPLVDAITAAVPDGDLTAWALAQTAQDAVVRAWHQNSMVQVVAKQQQGGWKAGIYNLDGIGYRVHVVPMPEPVVQPVDSNVIPGAQ